MPEVSRAVEPKSYCLGGQGRGWLHSAYSTMQIEECFRILDVSPTASSDEIRKAYRTLVNVWHPDRFAGNEALRAEAGRKLTSINEAFSTLEAAGFPQGSLRQQASTEVSVDGTDD